LLSAQLQGLEDNHTLVLVDGAPIIGRIAGQLDLARLSVQNIDRIEIVKGAASALYGSEAVGGVINILTRSPEERLSYAVNLNYGSFNSKNAKVDLSWAQNNTNLLMSGEYHGADGYDLDTSTENTTADDFNNFTVFGKIRQKISDTYSLQASGEYFSQRQEGFDGGNRITDTKNWYFNMGNDWRLKDHSNFKFRLYHTQYTKNIDRADVRVRNLEKLSRGEFIYNRVLANHILTAGGEITDNRLQTNRIQDGNRLVNNYSFYLQDEIFYKWIEFNLGVRADYHSQFDLHWSPKFGLLYKPNDKWRIRASFSKGFRAPDFIEMFLVLDHSGLTSQPYVAYGNSNLKPENSTSINFGSEYHFSSDKIIKMNFFYNYLRDMISSIFLSVDENGIQYYTYDNLSKAYTRGIEADVIIGFFNHYRLTAGYMFLETEDLNNDEPFFNRPKHSARVKFDWDFKRIGLSGNLRWRYVGDRLFVNFQGQKTNAPWYATWFTRVKQHIYKSLSIFAGVDNLFDYQNRNFVALPGRMIYIGITVD
jgi:outer membrane receptor for ferrienterochelin and colicins